MSVAELATEMVSTARAQGGIPSHVAVSPDLYRDWQRENACVEPIDVLGLPIQIRDNFKPSTILVLGKSGRTIEGDPPTTEKLSVETVIENIERGEYGPDAEAAALMRLLIRGDGSAHSEGAKIMGDFYDSLEHSRDRFAQDALQAVSLDTHPHAAEIYRFAEKMAGDEVDKTMCFAILRRIAGFIHGRPNH